MSLKDPPERTKADVDRVKRAILDVIGADPPMTVRQVFYQLVARGVIEKTERAYDKVVKYHMAHMRHDGELPYEWVVDETRRRRVTQTCDSVEDALEDCARYYRRSALDDADDYIELWIEKVGLAALVSDVADDYDVPVMPSGGFSSITFLHDTALHLERAHLCGKPAFIYQFGDWDPSGAITIPLTIEKQLNHMCEQLGCEPPTFERVALTREHIAEHSLPTRPTKREGNTHAKTFEGDSVELDALPPSVLRDMVREVIERHVDLHQVTLLRADEARERAIIQRLVDQHAGYAPRDAIQRLADYYAEFEDDRGESK